MKQLKQKLHIFFKKQYCESHALRYGISHIVQSFIVKPLFWFTKMFISFQSIEGRFIE